MEKSHVGTAFVTFNTQADARAVEARYGKGIIYGFWDFIFSLIFGSCQREGTYFLNGHRLHAEIAPEPSDILWENLEVSFKGRLIKSLKTYMVSLLALSVSIATVYMFS